MPDEELRMTKRARICCIGECMIEMSQVDLSHATARLGFAGDTLNTAVYLSRLGFDTSYVTLVGRDAFSDQMLRMMADEGLDVSCVGRHPTRLPGVYSITVDPAGERSFHYWRDRSAARRLFSDRSVSLDALSGFDVIYLSGITLAILPTRVREKSTRRLAELGRSGKTIVFDSNYRPRLWRSPQAARDAFTEMWRCTAIGLPSFDDETRLHPGRNTGSGGRTALDDGRPRGCVEERCGGCARTQFGGPRAPATGQRDGGCGQHGRRGQFQRRIHRGAAGGVGCRRGGAGGAPPRDWPSSGITARSFLAPRCPETTGLTPDHLPQIFLYWPRDSRCPGRRCSSARRRTRRSSAVTTCSGER